MEGTDWQPTVVVGIDFGMTRTAVAFSSAPEWARPEFVQKWPGRYIDSETANKVFTQVAYDDARRLISWGFECLWDQIPTSIEREFKLYLDPAFPDTFPNRPSHDEAVQYYKDYMTCLCRYLEKFFQSWFPGWSQRNVEFLFSIPTTWKSPWLTDKLVKWLTEAGFANPYNRRIKIYLTEAEAAAVCAAKQSFQVGDIVMVADAGGATTDINILEIKEHNRDRTRLKALSKAEGINVGSTLIDARARKVVQNQLRALISTGDEDDLHWTADDMLRDADFEAMKCSFDGVSFQVDVYMTVPDEKLPMAIRGRRQQVIVTAAELEQSFEEQLQVMYRSIDQQLLEFTGENPRATVRYLVLSGGLGSSRYVQRRMMARYPNIEILCAQEPQLAVAKGLVMDRVQVLSLGDSIYTGKCSRVSYGVLCRLPYDKTKNVGDRVTRDKLDGMIWAEDQIDWLVRAGQAVPDQGFTRPYRLKIATGEQGKSFEAQFVMSYSNAESLPHSLRGEEVSRICTVKAQFRNEEKFKHKRAGLLSKGKEHYIAEFNLKVIVGSADLVFELVSKDGQKYNINEARVEVNWEKAAPTPVDVNDQRQMFPAPLQ